MTCELFPVWGYYEECCYDHVCSLFCVFYVCISRSRTTESQTRHLFCFTRCYQIVFQSCYPTYITISIASEVQVPYSLTSTCFYVFFFLAILMVFTYIALRTPHRHNKTTRQNELTVTV